MPDSAELADVMQRIGMQHVELDHERQTVCFLQPGVEINLGSIGKGYALDRMAELLAAERIENFLLHGGNSSLLRAEETTAPSPQPSPKGRGSGTGGRSVCVTRCGPNNESAKSGCMIALWVLRAAAHNSSCTMAAVTDIFWTRAPAARPKTRCRLPSPHQVPLKPMR